MRSVAPADKAGRLIVGDDLRVPGLANVFAIGDTAASKAWKGETVPGLAPPAKQGGTYGQRKFGETVFDVIRRMWRRNAIMAVVVRGRGVPRGSDVAGVITKEHVADSVADSVKAYPQ